MKERFPDRPWFASWIKKDNLLATCNEVIKECTKYHPMSGTLRRNGSNDTKLEALYEFCASRGKLATFDAVWNRLEAEAKEEWESYE